MLSFVWLSVDRILLCCPGWLWPLILLPALACRSAGVSGVDHYACWDLLFQPRVCGRCRSTLGFVGVSSQERAFQSGCLICLVCFSSSESAAKLIRVPTAQQTTWPAQKVMNVRGHRIWLARTLENCSRWDKGTSGAAYSIVRNKGEGCYLYAKQSHKGMIFFFNFTFM